MAVPLVANLWDGLPAQEGGLSVALASSFVKRLASRIAYRGAQGDLTGIPPSGIMTRAVAVISS